MKKTIFMIFFAVILIVLMTIAIYAFVDRKSTLSKMPVENKLSEAVSGQIHQSDFGVVKAGAVSEMIANIKKSALTIQDIQTVHSEFEIKRSLGINGYGDILNLNIAPRSLYNINKLYPIEYINRIDEKTIYAVYKTVDNDNELCFMYLFFTKIDDQREAVQEDTETWWLKGKAFFIKNTLQYNDFSAIKVGSSISEVHAVDSMVNPEIGTDREYTEPFNSYHLLTDGVLRIEYAFDEADGIYRVAVLEYVDSFEIPILENGNDSTINVRINENDYPVSAGSNVK